MVESIFVPVIREYLLSLPPGAPRPRIGEVVEHKGIRFDAGRWLRALCRVPVVDEVKLDAAFFVEPPVSVPAGVFRAVQQATSGTRDQFPQMVGEWLFDARLLIQDSVDASLEGERANTSCSPKQRRPSDV